MFRHFASSFLYALGITAAIMVLIAAMFAPIGLACSFNNSLFILIYPVYFIIFFTVLRYKDLI